MSRENLISEKLIDRLIQGDEQSFSEIYRKLSPPLFCRLTKVLNSRDVAEEVLQEVFIAVWNSRHKIDPLRSFQSYVYCIAANKCYDYFRSVARNRSLLADMMKMNRDVSDDDESGGEKMSTLIHIIAQLPPRRRYIFEMCKLNGKTYAEVSSQLGISPSTISDHIVKANHFIRKGLLDIGT